MGEQNRLTPIQLGRRVVVGMSIYVLGVFTTLLIPLKYLRTADRLYPIHWMILFVSFALMAWGVVVGLLAQKRLKSGIDNEVWNEDELKALRLWINRPRVTTIVLIIWIACGAACLAGWLFRGSGHSSVLFILFFNSLYVPAMTFANVKMLLSPPLKRYGVDWSGMKPIHSEHWGEGRAPGENSIP
jgi:hypothetical protein